jgi:hypothetical protein
MTAGDTGPATFDDLRHHLLVSERIGPTATLTPLTGGVSSLVAVVADGDEMWVVKSPLRRLAVEDEWLVNRERGINEANVLALLEGRIGPADVPRLRFFDAEQTIIGPPPTYKEEFLEGRTHPDVARALGAATARFHRRSLPESLSGAGRRALFDDLRLDPYYRMTAPRRPEFRPALLTLIEETRAAPMRGPVHGDLTPKNILAGAGPPVIVDWEVVHVGDTAFDLATMTAHFIAKTLRPAPTGGVPALIEAARLFWSAYDGPPIGRVPCGTPVPSCWPDRTASRPSDISTIQRPGPGPTAWERPPSREA